MDAADRRQPSFSSVRPTLIAGAAHERACDGQMYICSMAGACSTSAAPALQRMFGLARVLVRESSLLRQVMMHPLQAPSCTQTIAWMGRDPVSATSQSSCEPTSPPAAMSHPTAPGRAGPAASLHLLQARSQLLPTTQQQRASRSGSRSCPTEAGVAARSPQPSCRRS